MAVDGKPVKPIEASARGKCDSDRDKMKIEKDIPRKKEILFPEYEEASVDRSECFWRPKLFIPMAQDSLSLVSPTRQWSTSFSPPQKVYSHPSLPLPNP